MVIYIKVNENMIKEMVKENLYGKLDKYMKEIGKMT